MAAQLDSLPIAPASVDAVVLMHAHLDRHPAVPLYTQRDAEACLGRLASAPFEQNRQVGSGITLRFLRRGSEES